MGDFEFKKTMDFKDTKFLGVYRFKDHETFKIWTINIVDINVTSWGEQKKERLRLCVKLTMSVLC